MTARPVIPPAPAGGQPHRSRGTALRLTVAVTALSAAAVGAVAMPSGAAHADGSAPAAAKGATSISIRAVHPRVRTGGKDAITGDLKIAGADEQGRSVTLEAKAAGEPAYTPVGTDTAGPHGGLRLVVHPAASTRYRWHYDGAADARARTSGTVAVRVTTGDGSGRAHRLPTSLSIRAVHRFVSAQGAGAGTDTIAGRLRSRRTALPHRTVVLLARAKGADGWRYVGAHDSGKHGQVAFVVHPRATTAYQLRYAGSTVFRPAHSGTATVGVRRHPSATISAEPASVDPGDSTAISTVVTQQGQPISGATVDLLARPAAHPRQRFTQVGTTTTATDGAAGLEATPARSTVYRWRVEAGSGHAAGSSKALLVAVRHATSLSIRGKHVTAGYVVGGSLRGAGHPLAHRPVLLLAAAPGTTTYSEVASARTGRHGAVSFTRPEAAGTSYRLEYDGNGRYAASTSGTVTD